MHGSFGKSFFFSRIKISLPSQNSGKTFFKMDLGVLFGRDLSADFQGDFRKCLKEFVHPKNHWTLQWKGLNLYIRGPGPQNSHF